MKTVEALGDMILVKLHKKNETVSGIVLPDGVQSESEFIVVDIGGKVTRVKKGDSVIYNTKKSFTINGSSLEKGLFMIKEEDIIGKLVDKA